MKNEILGNDESIVDADELLETSPYRYSITSYGADYPVDGLVKRMESDAIIVPSFDPEEPTLDDKVEGYQRQFVWSKTQCDRFIESLLLGLPVPGIFLVKLPDSRLLVLDGQQRLRTLQAFYMGVLKGAEFSLQNVQKHLKDLKYKSLNMEERRLLDDSIIHATIIRQDEPEGDLSSIYLIFERLNTGGTTLYPQEIRVALYRGGLIKLLRELNNFKPWRSIYGKKSNRIKDQELILRFFALLYWSDEYVRPMKDFLNRYAHKNREFEFQSRQELQDIFKQTIETTLKALGVGAFRLKKTINAAVMDSVMVGIGHRLLKSVPITDFELLKKRYDELLKNDDFQSAVVQATTDNESVRTRLKLAKEAMSGV